MLRLWCYRGSYQFARGEASNFPSDVNLGESLRVDNLKVERRDGCSRARVHEEQQLEAETRRELSISYGNAHSHFVGRVDQTASYGDGVIVNL